MGVVWGRAGWGETGGGGGWAEVGGAGEVVEGEEEGAEEVEGGARELPVAGTVGWGAVVYRKWRHATKMCSFMPQYIGAYSIHNTEFGRLLVDALKSKLGLSSTDTHVQHRTPLIQTPMGQEKVFTLGRSPF